MPQIEAHSNYVPHVPHFEALLRHKIGDQGSKNERSRHVKYRKYVPQNVAQKNFVPQVPQIVAQFVAQVWHKIGDLGPKTKNYP